MPVVKVKGASAPPTKGAARKSTRQKVKTVAPLEVSLPDGPEAPIEHISEATMLIYGEPKIGKTSFCSKFDDALFLMFEPGGKGLRIARRQMGSWEEFTQYIDLLVENTDRFATVIIDPVDVAYKMCVDYILEKEGADDPSEVAWGNGWKAIDDEFTKQVLRIADSRLKRGVVFVSHVELREFQRRLGSNYHKMVPSMMKQARKCISGFVDIIGYYGYYGAERYLTLEGSDEVEAGRRLEENFLTASGERIHSIPMGGSSQEAYDNFLAAFANEQEDRCEPDAPATLSETSVKRVSKKPGR